LALAISFCTTLIRKIPWFSNIIHQHKVDQNHRINSIKRNYHIFRTIIGAPDYKTQYQWTDLVSLLGALDYKAHKILMIGQTLFKSLTITGNITQKSVLFCVILLPGSYIRRTGIRIRRIANFFFYKYRDFEWAL